MSKAKIKVERNLFCGGCHIGGASFCDCCKVAFKGGQVVHCIGNYDHICNKCFKKSKKVR